MLQQEKLRLIEEQQQRELEEKRIAEEQHKKELEKQRKKEEEEERLMKEKKRLEEEALRRKLEEQRKKEEEEAKRLEKERKKEEKQRKVEEDRRRKEEEKERKAEEKRKKEENEKQRLEELKRKAVDEDRMKKEEEARRRTEEKARLEEQRKVHERAQESLHSNSDLLKISKEISAVIPNQTIQAECEQDINNGLLEPTTDCIKREKHNDDSDNAVKETDTLLSKSTLSDKTESGRIDILSTASTVKPNENEPVRNLPVPHDPATVATPRKQDKDLQSSAGVAGVEANMNRDSIDKSIERRRLEWMKEAKMNRYVHTAF